MYVHKGGGLYGFCPGKATWDHEATSLFELMVVTVEHKAMLVTGGLADQPGWFVKLLAWFGPAYRTKDFISKARMVLGEESDTSQNSVGAATKPSGKRR